ncbi:hypothetical protein JTB14_031073 [Gonioctena quinquepunctata]|nr:hypothetical protein JTB14_031073 [Gonioctena quinquepunctata]
MNFLMMLNEADSDREAYQRLLNDHHILEQYNGELKNILNAQGSQGLHRRNNEMPEHHGYGSVRSTISNSSARKKLENIDWKAGFSKKCELWRMAGGQPSSGSLSQDGPAHHKELVRSSDGSKPLDAGSAGLSSEDTWCQWIGGTLS